MLQAQFRAIRARFARDRAQNAKISILLLQPSQNFFRAPNFLWTYTITCLKFLLDRFLRFLIDRSNYFLPFFEEISGRITAEPIARDRARWPKKKEKFLKNWDISKTKRAMIIIFLIIKTSDFFWISDKKIVSKKYFLASVESLFSN